MNIYESSEDYLERILMLCNKIGNVRAIDIAHSMNFSKPSVSIAMKKLSENGYIQILNNGYIVLTEKGREIAENVYEKHELLSKILMHLGVDETTALSDACKLEHNLSSASFEAIKKYYLENLKKEQ